MALSEPVADTIVPRKGQRAPAPDQVTYTADSVWPARWWIAGTHGQPPRESTRYERARVASLALQNAIRAARTAVPDSAPDDARTDDHDQPVPTPYTDDHDQAASASHTVDPADQQQHQNPGPTQENGPAPQ